MIDHEIELLVRNLSFSYMSNFECGWGLVQVSIYRGQDRAIANPTLKLALNLPNKS